MNCLLKYTTLLAHHGEGEKLCKHQFKHRDKFFLNIQILKRYIAEQKGVYYSEKIEEQKGGFMRIHISSEPCSESSKCFFFSNSWITTTR